jgi:hypothetical protein
VPESKEALENLREQRSQPEGVPMNQFWDSMRFNKNIVMVMG